MSTKEITKTLGGGEFLIAESQIDQIFTPEDLSEESRMMAEMTRDFVDKEIIPHVDAIDAQQEGLLPSILEKAGALGLLGTSIPEEYGGAGLDFNTNTGITMAMGPSYSFGVSWAAHIGIGTLPILYYGTEEQKQYYLPKLASGEWKAAYCLTEPGSGSDALGAKTKAVLNDAGTHYAISGQKMWITNGGFADLFIVFAKINGEKDKFTAFIVDANAEGVTRGEEEKKMGIKGSSTRQIFFEGVLVPKENILGEIGKGHKIAFNILNIGRFKLGAMCAGGCQMSAARAIAYANERHQFGVPISSFGAIQHKLAEQAIRTYALETTTYRISDLVDRRVKDKQEEGHAYPEALMDAAEEYAIECAMLKVFGSEVLDFVVDETVQVHGGYGFSEEFPAARAYRDSRINRIFEGTNEINRLLTVDMLLKRAMKGQLDMLGPAMSVQKELMSIPDFGDDPSGYMAKEWKAVKQAKKAILMAAGAAAQQLMQKLDQEQELIMNLTDMAIDVYAMESMLLRTQKIKETKGEEAALPYLEMTQVFVSDGLERVHINGKHAVAAFATGDELRMMLLGIKRFTKYEVINTKELRRNIAARLIEANDYCF